MLRHLSYRGNRARCWFCVALVTLLVVTAPGGFVFSAHAAEPTIPQTRTDVSRAGTLIGRTNAAQMLDLAVPLKPQNQPALDGFLADLYNPASPTYGQYLTPKQYTQRFFDPTARKTVVQYLQSQGFTVNDPGIGAMVDATGSVAQVEHAFTVTISDYRDATGHVYYANDVTPALPLSIASLTDGIIGLDSTEAAKHAGMPAPPQPTRSVVTPQSGTGCSAATTVANARGSYLPNQFSTAYNFDALHALGFHGEGQTVAVFELTDYPDADPAAYQMCFGIAPAVPLTRVLVDGAVLGNYAAPGEADGDIETLVGLDPNLAGVLVYEAPNTGTAATDLYQRIANDNFASVVSTSWYQCEPYLTSTRQNAENTIFQQMAAQGQSIFAAAGDYGSTSCLQFTSTTHKHDLSLDDPSSQPYVTGVGGTNMTINGATNAYTSEHIWNNYPASFGAGGGGLSILWPKPTYQVGPGTAGTYANGMRQVPDVTATGDCQWTFSISGAWAVYCGTSFATPLWAAGTALLNQYLASHGRTPIGFANPALYSVLKSAAYGIAFHDVTTGDNCFDAASTCGNPNPPTGKFPATANYDLASGIGSPNFGNLAAALIPTTLPPAKPVGGSSGSPNPLPSSRTPGGSGGSPNLLPSPRP